MTHAGANQAGQAFARIAEGYMRTTPHNQALGAQVLSAEPGAALLHLPFRVHFTGDIDAGLWHTSVAVSLLDATCGLAVLLALPKVEAIATLDLRTDYLRPAVITQPLYAYAHCYHVTRHMAFVRGQVYQANREKLTVHCTAAFMRTSRTTHKPAAPSASATGPSK